jgi:hypothetical protein
MIYCNLKGGLGNMLFQIAATKSIAIDNNTDCSFPNLESHIQYLNSEKTYNPRLNYGGEYMSLLKNLNVLKPTTNKLVTYPFNYIQSPSFSEDVIIDGFFQSEKYFSHNRTEILNFIKPTPEIISIINDKYGNVLKRKCTSIHVRRGDYVRHPNHHPVQTLEYYNGAINTLKDKTETFIVFSDDIEWCKINLNFDNVIYIEGEKDYIELYLMSLCDNNITSNSSFSWWGAWLNENENKTVIGPNKWFGPAINHDTSDIIPETWIKM